MEKKYPSPSLEKEGDFIKRKSKKACLICALLFLTLFLSFFPRPSGATSVIEVRIQGCSVIKEDEIKKVITQPEFAFSKDKVREDLQAIYDMGYFFSVRAFKETTPEGIILIYEVKEYPVVSRVEFVGVEDKEEKKLEELTTLEIGKPWNYKKAQETKSKILDYFRKIGYTQAKVDFSPPSSEKDIGVATFSIDKGERARVIEVEISGNSFFSDVRVRSFMQTRFKRYFDPQILKEDIKKIVKKYQKEGFYFARVDPVEFKFFEKDRIRWVRIFLQVNEGKRFRMGKLSIEGNKVLSEDEIKEYFRPIEGQIFNLEKAKDSVRKIQQLYGEKGYLHATVNSSLHVDEEKEVVNVALFIKENNQIHVGRIKVEGNEVSKERVFKHTILLKPGDIFSTSEMIESWRRLYNLGFFERVDMEPVDTPDPSVMDLLVKVKEKERTGSLLFGASYSSSLGFGGFVQLSKDNLWGEGKMLSLDWEFGQRKNNYQVDYIDRWWRDTPTRLELGLYNKDYKFYDGDEGYTKNITGGKVSLGRPWFSNFTLFLTLKSEKTLISPIEDKTLPSGVEEGEKSYQSIRPALLWDSRVRDEAFNPYKGWYGLVWLEKSGGFLGGDVDFTRYSVEVRSYYRHGKLWRSPALALRLRGKWGENLPVDEQFYVGGQDTLRGYSVNEFRGSQILLGTVELRIPVTQNLLGYLFIDAAKIQDASEIQEKVGYGFGMRITSPVGIIRLDYGIGEENEARFYFGMGDVF